MGKYERFTERVKFPDGMRFCKTLYSQIQKLEDAIEDGTLVEFPCKWIEELDIIEKGMIFILYKMFVEQNLEKVVFLKYKSKINEWFNNYRRNINESQNIPNR